MSQKLKRYDSLVVENTLPVVPTYNEKLNCSESFLPQQAQRDAPSNKIQSTRYTPLTFFPIALLQQYKKVIVCLYTFNTIVQMFPAVATNTPLVSLVPVLFIILLGMGKELYLEVKRYKEDKRVNAMPCHVLSEAGDKQRGLSFVETEVQNLRVGDIIRLRDGDYVPADCAVLQGSQENGQVFTQTDALDGERNFKSKLALPTTQDQLSELLASNKIRMFVPTPTPDIYDFKARIEYAFPDENGASDQMLNLQFIPRASVIRNSGEISCIVCYTGVETKLMQNMGSYKFKRANTEKRLQNTYLANLAIFILLIITCTVWNGFRTSELFDKHFYLTQGDDDSTVATLQSAVSFFLLFNYIIPLDLPVTIELAAIIYSNFIYADAQMTYLNKEMGRVERAKMNSLNLIENLGEVEYIMSDKTGTLTKNELTLVAASCDSRSSYLMGKTFTKDEIGSVRDKPATLGEYLHGQSDFLKCVLLCQDCTILEIGGKKSLTGASLDEQCILNAVQEEKQGRLMSRAAKQLSIQLDGKDLVYELVLMNEFTSERKLMSVLVREPDTGKYFVFAKGAETQIMSRLSSIESHSAMKEHITSEVFNFGNKGLRTLVFAFREMSELEFNSTDWTDLADPQKLSDLCEQKLSLLGCTGVEDELQDDVVECIQEFRDAGIKFWMLTGDMGHTAKEIGYNCGVMSRDENVNAVYKLESVDKQSLTAEVDKFRSEIHQSRTQGKSVSLMISGQTFQVADTLDDASATVFKREILLKADSVILFRSSPQQKAVAVKIVKDELKGKKLTLAIGDGFNDVNMIQSAHVGIGIQGKESNQAAAFADFAIVKFRDLRRLLFWHGRSYTHKIIFMVLMNFYKVWCRIWIIFILNSQNGMSAVVEMYGLVFALFPVVFCQVLGLWWCCMNLEVDQSKDSKSLPFKLSDLYRYHRKDIFNYYKYYIGIVFVSLLPCLINGVSFFMAEKDGAIDESGKALGFFTLGLTNTTQVVISYHILFTILQSNFDWPWFLAFFFSFMWIWVTYFVVDGAPQGFYYKSIYTDLLTSSFFWCNVFCGVAAGCLPIYAWLKYRDLFGGNPIFDKKTTSEPVGAKVQAIQMTQRTELLKVQDQGPLMSIEAQSPGRDTKE